MVYKKRNYEKGDIFEKLILEVKKNGKVSVKILFETWIINDWSRKLTIS